MKRAKARGPFTFVAEIYVVGINPAVDIPGNIVQTLSGNKKSGYIKVKGVINSFAFRTTLVPVKARPYRLFINGDMRRGAGVNAGDRVTITLEKDEALRELPVPFPLALALEANPSARAAWAKLTPSRRKEILSSLNYLKTPEALEKNVKKVIQRLKTE